MEIVLVAATAFAGAIALDSVVEIGAEISAGWTTVWMDHYFWDISPDESGSEAQRLTAELLARVPDGDGYKELCALPLIPDAGAGVLR